MIWPGPTRASLRCSRSPRWRRIRSSPRGVTTTATHPNEGTFRQLAPLLAGMDRGATVEIPDQAVTDTEHLLKEAGVDGETVAAWVAKGVVA